MEAVDVREFVYTEIHSRRKPDIIVNMSPWKHKTMHYYEEILIPFHNSLRVFGLMYKNKRSSVRNVKIVLNCGKLYHWTLVVILWANVLRYFGAYSLGESFGLELTHKLVIHAVLFWGASAATAVTKVSTQRPVVFKKWEQYLMTYNITHSDQYYKNQKNRVTMALMVCWTSFFGHGAGVVYANFAPHLSYYVRIAVLPFVDPCNKTQDIYPTIVIIVFSLYVIITMIFMLQLGYLLLMTLGIADEFSHFNRRFLEHITIDSGKSSSSFQGDIETWRLRHLDLCRIVDEIDAAFGLHVLLMFASNIPVCSFLVYRILVTMSYLYGDTGIVHVITLLFVHFGLSVGILLVITYVGTRINTEVCI